MKKNIAVVVGTRPELLKLAPIVNVLNRLEDEVHTDVYLSGQHKELLAGLLDLFNLDNVEQLDLPQSNGSLSKLTANLLTIIDQQILSKKKYDAIIVQGDTTTVLASALAAFYRQIPVAHVEAGLRTNKRMEPFPEELNRQLVSKIATWHFCPTEQSKSNLLHESIFPNAIEVCGNTIIDSLEYVRSEKIAADYEDTTLSAEAPELFEAIQAFKESGGETISLLTLHRRENQGPELNAFFESIKVIANKYPKHHFVYPYHLNPGVKDRAVSILSGVENIHLIAPLSYRPFVYLMKKSDFVMSDSGGVQEELPSLRKPLLILRSVTERPEVVSAGFAKLVGLDTALIKKEVEELILGARLGAVPNWFTGESNPFGNGTSSVQIVSRILKDLIGSKNIENENVYEESGRIINL